MKNKTLATAYVKLISVDNEIKFEYGYDLDKLNLSINDIGMFLSFISMLKNKAEQDFSDRLDVQEKEFEVKRE